jgi:hypothetical protein
VHGNEIKTEQESGGGGAGAAGRTAGRSGPGEDADVGATQGQCPQGGAGTVVEKVEKVLKCC